MLKSSNKCLDSPRMSQSKLSPVARRKMKKYKDSASSSLPVSAFSRMSLSGRSLTRMTSEEVKEKLSKKFTWSPQLKRKQIKPTVGREESLRISGWTKLRHSLEFIRKSKELSNSNVQNAETGSLGSLTFLGQVCNEDEACPPELENCMI